MRIIGGSLKSRSINFVKSLNTRPLKDKVRESIFNILKHSNYIKTKIENAIILDLYSGIGSFGIECISRGARKVIFIEHDKNAIDILEENITKLKINKNSIIHNNKVEKFLKKKIKEKFDIFFFDPPFSDTTFLQNLVSIKRERIFNKDHIVIIHREQIYKDEFKDLLKIIDIKQYGRSKILFGVFK